MIADANHVRVMGNMPNSLSDAVINPHLRHAGRRLKRWVGDAPYAESETEAGTLGTPKEFSGATAQCQALADAEAYLAIAVGIMSWNTVMQSSGSKAAGIARDGIIGESTFRYMSPSEIETMQDNMVRKAEEAAALYVVEDFGGGSPGPERSFAIDDDGAEIDDDWPE